MIGSLHSHGGPVGDRGPDVFSKVIVCAVHTKSPTELPTVAPLVAIPRSVTALPLASASPSRFLQLPVCGTTTHNQDASIGIPSSRNPGLLFQWMFRPFSRIAFSTDRSEMLFSLRSRSHNFVSSVSGEISDILLSASSRVLNSVSPARGDRSDMLLLPRPRALNFVSSARGDMSEMLLSLRYSISNPVNLASGDRSDIGGS